MAQVVSLDLVRRAFRCDRPNELWLTDTTEHPTREDTLCCWVVLDVYSRLVVGWSLDSAQTMLLVLNALGMATQRRKNRDGLSSTPRAAASSSSPETSHAMAH